MAALPRPIGIGTTLVNIATGIGRSAKRLPSLSRSDVGAVAMKSARVRVEFEMARVAERSADGIELGVRTFGIAAALVSQTERSQATNRGVIEFEIVAITQADRPQDGASGKDDTDAVTSDTKLRERVVRVIELLKVAGATDGLDEANRKVVDELRAQAEAALAAGDLQQAAAHIAAIEKIFTNAQAPRPPAQPAAVVDVRDRPAPRAANATARGRLRSKPRGKRESS